MSRVGVIGLGYVGLPLAVEASKTHDVLGFDLNPTIVESLNAGRSHVDDISDEMLASALTQGFRSTGDVASLKTCEVIVICVPTPLSADGGPDLGAVVAAGHAIADHMAEGTLVVLESTTYPGTTEEVLLPILSKSDECQVGVDFYLAFSPERIDPGNTVFGLRNTPKVVGGVTAKCLDAATTFYASVVDAVVPARGTREAESAKLLENTYRHVNIALMNEMARFFHEMNIDVWDVIHLASTKPFGFQAFRPGPGVGGHCIPIDPNYLSHRVRSQLGYGFRFVELAQEINASMPAYVTMRAMELLNRSSQSLNGARILLLGVTYKPDIADERESPAVPLALKLVERGAILEYHDPHVEEWSTGIPRTDDLEESLRQCDLSILLQNHSSYDMDSIVETAKSLLDTRGVTAAKNVHRL